MGVLSLINFIITVCAFLYHWNDVNYKIWINQVSRKEAIILRMKAIFFTVVTVVVCDLVLFWFIALEILISHTVLQ